MKHIKIFYLLAVITTITQVSKAQVINGYVVDNYNNDALAGVSVRINGTPMHTDTNDEGRFEFNKLKRGTYELEFSLLGMKTIRRKVEVESNRSQTIKVAMAEDNTSLKEVVVESKSALQQVRETPFNVVAIDAKVLHNTTLDVASALDRISGVKVRADGGVGSDMSLSLNGFSGRHVKLFMDGVPMDGFGAQFKLNNIPIGMVDRIEVYKGVVPIEFGADALGGVINLVTNKTTSKKTHLDASFAAGSFDTYKSEVNFAKIFGNGFAVQLNAFHTFSENNYKVYIQPKGEPGKWYERFNDRYNSGTATLKLGFVDKPFADRLFVGFTYGQGRKGIQHGTTMDKVFGKRHQHSETIMPNLEYMKKNFFLKGLNVKLTGNYNLGYIQNIDTVAYIYDWSGTATPKSSKGESGGGPTMTKNFNNNGSLTLNATYRINEKHRFDINDVFTTFNRKTEDPLAIKETESETKSEETRRSLKNITGLSYIYTMNKSFNVSLFGKHYWTKHTYLQDTRTSSIMGYGAALAYSLFDMQLKGSYERTHRLPSATELFGDGALEWANFDLKPEKGDNFNIGLSGSRTFGRNHMAYFDVSYNYRYITNYIRRNVYGEGSRASVENFGKVLSSGVNAEVRYNYRGLLTIGGNITSQNVKNNEKYKQGGDKVPSTTYKMRMPNVPYLFGNADAGITVRNLGVKGNDLFVGYNLHYIHEFYYDWSIYGEKDSKDMVPSQLSHDVNVSYSFLKKHFNVSAEVNNITNEKLYDNYYIQKPGRNFIIKLRYIY